MKTETKNRVKNIFKYLFLVALILEMLLLSVEALLPGDASSQSSGAFGDAVDDIVTNASEDVIRDVRPEEIMLKRNGKTIESLTLKHGASARLSVGYSPSTSSVNYRDVEWSSEDETIARVNGNGKVFATGIGETVITASLTAFPQIKAQLSVQVTEVIAEEFTLCFGDGDTKITLEVGDKAALLPTLTPAADQNLIEYESGDPEVATVVDGAVEAVGVGETVIRGKYTPVTDPEKALVCEVRVAVNARTHPKIPIENLLIDLQKTPAVRSDAEAPYLYAGDVGSFQLSLFPEDTTENAVIWKTSNKDVLFVNAAGEFEARAKGSATLTAISADNSAIRAQCTLEVRNRTLGVTLEMTGGELTPSSSDPDTFTLALKAGTRDVAFSFSCEDEKQIFVKYDTSDNKIAQVYKDGTLAALRSSASAENGTVSITVTVADNSEFSSENGNLAKTYSLIVTVERQDFSDSVDGWGLLVRKLFGHFGAFLAVGVTAAVTAILFDNGSWKRRLLFLAMLIVFGFTFACFTELLQTELFTTGRAAAFSDVIIDCQGYMPAMLAVYGIFLIVSLVILIVKSIRQRPKKE